jgi:5-methylcytosine-specific restriction endonuclease McrA
MIPVSPNTKSTLLLNTAWQPITTVTARASFGHMLKKRISGLDKDGAIFHSLDTWNEMGNFYDDQPALRSARAAWPVPTIIIVTSKFFRKPKKKRLSLYEMAKICDYKCQYCMNKFKLKDLTIDHIVPRSRGGSNEPENLTPACRFCNQRKGNIEHWTDVMGNIPKPIAIPAFLFDVDKIREEWKPFLKHLI